MSQVICLGDLEGGLLEALRDGRIDALARAGNGNGDAAHRSSGAFVVAVLDCLAEYGGSPWTPTTRS